ncbi:fatty acid synthase [Colletotrichum zoysiae]|uniref:Fatty acid synthase n=1 Tax=Colletotrichum zoysiae TaxID=1216348 RepID=A0AAD9HB71_9PEZI|nr:fatty acid synthase [Colletotrichum zoysiae]
MPYVQDSSSPAETNSSSGEYPGQQQTIVDDATYAARNPPCPTEKPLSEQLEPIAVVGMGCRLPGSVSSPADFWKLMMSKGTGQNPKVPESRFNIDAHYHKNNDRPGSFHVLGGYFVDGTLQEFDPSFFGITPIEAMWMDPQQRKLLEVVYESVESAGVTLEDISGSKTAVFAASFTADFQQTTFKEPSFRHAFAATGVDPGIISNRISHAFNLKGPSIVVNTACSSSVYAMHNACNALRNKECEAAVVCGVNLVLTVDQHMNTAKLGRLSDAIRDGDPIRAVIRSSATNNNGKVPAVGITHPNRDGQVEVIRHAYHRGGNLDPCLTGFFECHGTGTAIGDPLEVHAVSLAMNDERTDKGKPLLIGAVKTNIGHSEAASGLSAVIKVVLVAERGVIPPTRGITKSNPKIQWSDWKVATHNDAVVFPQELPVRRVSVNSFGYGGTNAHIIIEGADSLLTQKQSYKYIDNTTTRALSTRTRRVKMPRGTLDRNRPFLLAFSAHDKAALERRVAALAQVSGNYDLLDLSYTLASRRTRFLSRGYAVVSPGSRASATAAGSFDGLVRADNKKTPTIGFVFTGQGGQWPRMGAELMAYYPSFRRTIQVLDMTLGDLENAPEWTIEEALLEPAPSSRVQEAEFAQPLTTAIQIALVQLLRVWGVRPVVTVGHSSGEIAAAYAAGYISASEAIAMAYCRGQVVRDINTNGAMMAVGIGAEAVEPYISQLNGPTGSVSVACHNSPSGVTLSGDAAAIDELQERLAKEKIFARVVKTGGKAYHSPHMIPASESYERLVRASKASLLPFDLPLETGARMVSSVTNSILPKDAVLNETYFSANLRNPVLFNQAVQTILTAPEFQDVDLLVEIGPHSAMSGPIRQIKTALGAAKLEYLPTLLRDKNCAAEGLRLAGDLFIVDLPSYPWSKKQFWAEARHSIEHRQPKHPRHDILGSLLPGASLSEPTWRNILRVRDVPWLKDHSLGGEAVFPAAAYFSMAMEAMTQMTELVASNVEITNYVLRDVSIKKALVTPDDDNGIEVMLNMRPVMSNPGEAAGAHHSWWDFNVSSIDQDGVTKDHMTGSITINAQEARPQPSPAPGHLTRRASGKEWNQALRAVGFDYGPTFADMTDIGFNGKDYICTCNTAAKAETGTMVDESRHVLHPATVDSCLQLMIASIYAGRTKAMGAGAVPIQVDEVTIWKPTASQLADGGRATAMSYTSERGLRSFNCGSELVANDGQLLMEITNMRCTLYEAAIPQAASEAAKPMPYGEMVWRPDVESLTAVVGGQLPVAEYLDLSAFKNAGTKVLDVDGTQAVAILNRVPDLIYTAAVANPDAPLEDAVSQCKNAKLVKWDARGTLADLGLTSDSFNIVVLPASIDKDLLGSFRECPTLLLLDEAGRVTSVLSNSDPKENTKRQEKRLESDIIQLVYRNTPPSLLDSIVRSFHEIGRVAAPVKLLEMATVNSHVVVLDLEKPMLVDLNADEFAAFQKITNIASTLLWVSDGGIMRGQTPGAAMACGLMRAIRAEQATIRIATVDFDREATSDHQVSRWVTQNAVRQIDSPAGMETEYCIAGGKPYICRLVPHDRINNTVQTDGRMESVPFEKDLRMQGTVVSGKLVFEHVPGGTAADILDPDAVEVQVRFAGLNKEGVLVISGSDYPTDYSHDMGGFVVRIGSAVAGLAVGDSVVGFSLDRFSSYQTVSASMLQKVHPEESLLDLTSMALPYVSALYGLKRLADVQKGESVLILQDAGFGGAAAIDLSTALGAIPYVVAADVAQATRIVEIYGLTRQQVLSSPEEVHSFLRSGVDVVYGSGWSPHWLSREAWRSIAPSGRFVDSGRKKVLNRHSLDTVPFHRGASYHSYDIVDMLKCKPATVSELLVDALRLHREGRIALRVPPQTVKIAELDRAVARFGDNLVSSRTVVEYAESATPLQMLPSVELVKFSGRATYLLVGCLGGLGRSLTYWMMRNGARNFCFLSRSGADAKRAAALVSDLKASGADVLVVRGDASVPEDVRRAVASVPADRPLRGVVQAAMVLRDGLFHSMSFEDWETSIRPKVHGTANLQDALADTPLDFFLMTSSVSGILGTPGQSNYAAANSFLDALARHRRSRDQNTCAAIVPMVLGVGVVAENEDLEDALTKKGMYGIDEEQLLRAFEIAIHEQKRPKDEGGGIDHLVIGLDPHLLAEAMNSAGTDEAFWMADPRFRTLLHHLRSGPAAVGSGGEGGADLLSSLLAAATGAEAVLAAREAIEGKLGRMLLLDADAFGDLAQSVASYGIDSMIGAELRNWLFKEFGLDVPFQQLLGPSLTPTKLGEQICASHGIAV